MSKAACLPLYLCHSVCVSYPGWSSVKTAKLIPGLFLLLVQRRRNNPLETRNRGSAFGKSEGTFTALTFLSAWKQHQTSPTHIISPLLFTGVSTSLASFFCCSCDTATKTTCLCVYFQINQSLQLNSSKPSYSCCPL